MTDAPRDYREAVALLLDRLPELIPAWEEQCRVAGESDAESIGIYVVFGQMILPLLLLLLPGSDAWGEGQHLHGDAWRHSLRAAAIWEWVPADDTGVDDLLSRLYQVIDLWMATPSVDLRHAIWIELVETGYVDLTVEDLVSNAGPLLREMVSQGTPNPVLPI